MSVAEVLKTVGEVVQGSASVTKVFGEPVVAGDRTVIPVARCTYGFGGGAGRKGGDQGGGGGGGHVCVTPVGVIEVSRTGTRFVPIGDWRKAAAVAAMALGIGMILGRRRG